MGCSQSVSNILKKTRLTGSVRDLKIPGQKRKTTKREDRIMVRKACPIAQRLHRIIKQRCRLNMVKVSLLLLPDEDWERLVPTAANKVTICATSEQFFLTASVIRSWIFIAWIRTNKLINERLACFVEVTAALKQLLFRSNCWFELCEQFWTHGNLEALSHQSSARNCLPSHKFN